MGLDIYFIAIIIVLIFILLVMLKMNSKITRHNKDLEHAIYRLIEIVKLKS